MPIATDAARETREMRLFSAVLGKAGPLPTYIARHRAPGPYWLTWERIAIDLYERTHESVTREGLRKWARRYGIPEDTSPADTSLSERRRYASALKRAGVHI